MKMKAVFLSLGLLLTLGPVHAAKVRQDTKEPEAQSSTPHLKPALYVCIGLATIYGVYAITQQRLPGGAFFLAGLKLVFPDHQGGVPQPGQERRGRPEMRVHDADHPPSLQTALISPRHYADPLTPRTLQAVRLLLVEDEMVQRMVAERRLRQMGATVEVVADAAAALAAIEDHGDQIDVVLMDNNMPQAQGQGAVPDAGLQAVRRIRTRSDPRDYRGPTILMHSANSIPPEVLVEVGADGEIVKGASGNEIYAGAILDALELRKKE